jgi:hypothetical protein
LQSRLMKEILGEGASPSVFYLGQQGLPLEGVD